MDRNPAHRTGAPRPWWPVPVATLLVLVLSCGPGHPPVVQNSPPPPVVIVALDGLSWQVAGPLSESGDMPVLAGLAAAGASGRLETIRPTWTPVIFTTMATGKMPADHGINTFVSDEGIPLTSNLLRVPALWNILTRLDLPSLFFGWPVTWPAEEVRGEMISDRWHKTAERQVWPPSLARVIDPVLQDFRDREPVTPAELLRLEELATVGRVSPHLHGSFEGTGAATADTGTPDRLVQLTRKKVESGFLWNAALDFEVRLPLFLGRMEAVQPRLAAVYFNATDMSQHFFGGADDAAVGRPEPNPAGREAIDETYRVYDLMLGRLVDGVRALKGYENSTFVTISDHGIDLACGLQVRLHPPVGSTGQGLERIRSLVTGNGEVPAAVVEAPGRDSGWFILRFPPDHGMSERSRLLNRLDLAGCEFHPDDVFLYFVHDEAPPGVVVVSGGLVAAGQAISGMSVVDVAPTILALLGLPAAEDMAGRTAELLLNSDAPGTQRFLRTELLPSYGSIDRTGQEGAISSPEDETIRDELKAMGYIE